MTATSIFGILILGAAYIRTLIPTVATNPARIARGAVSRSMARLR